MIMQTSAAVARASTASRQGRLSALARGTALAFAGLALLAGQAYAMSPGCAALNNDNWAGQAVAFKTVDFQPTDYSAGEIVSFVIADNTAARNGREGRLHITGSNIGVSYLSRFASPQRFYISGSASATFEPAATTGGAAFAVLRNTNGALVSVTFTCTAPSVAAEPRIDALSLDGGVALDQAFSGNTTSYTASVPHATTAVSVTASLRDANATMRVNGTPLAQGQTTAPINLAVGANTIAVDTVAEDGMAQKAYSIVITRAAAPPSAGITFTPSAGALPDAMAGEAYGVESSADGVGPQLYDLALGTLPAGLTLNRSTGALTGPLQAGTEGNYSFSLGVTDAASNTATVAYTLVVKPRAVTAPSKEIKVNAGATPVPVNLETGATGGPFTEAAVAFVEPANAGKAEIIRGEVAAAGPVPQSWYVRFTPNPGFSGSARVGYRLTGALGSATGTITYQLNSNLAALAQQIDTQVDAFVGTRQGLLQTMISVPGLLERRNLEGATSPVSGGLTPRSDGFLLNFATSLIQSEAADRAAGLVAAGPVQTTAFNAWMAGSIAVFNTAQTGKNWGSFALFSAGADYLVTDRLLVGLSLHIDRMSSPTDQDMLLDGTGWLAGPYASLEIGDGVFLDGKLQYGGSVNAIDTAFFDGTFDTTRWMADVSLSGQWMLADVVRITPKLRAVYLREQVADYVVVNAAGAALGIDGSTTEQMRVSLGLDVDREVSLSNGLTLVPRLGVSGGLAALDTGSAFGTISAGLGLSGGGNWRLDLNGLISGTARGDIALGTRVGVSSGF